MVRDELVDVSDAEDVGTPDVRVGDVDIEAEDEDEDEELDDVEKEEAATPIVVRIVGVPV